MKNFLIGLLSGALAVAMWLLKSAKPIINTDTYIEKADQSIKKLKQTTRAERRQERRRLRKLKNISHD